MGRLRSIIKDEEKLYAFLKRIDEGYATIGLRRGTEAKNEVYTLPDFGPTDDIQNRMDEIYWQVKPYTKWTEKTDK